MLPKSFNPQLQQAYDILSTSKRHVFISGKAGTGKSTFLQYLQATIAKNTLVVAPTGLAAVNIGGKTIHSQFLLAPDITPVQAYAEGSSKAPSKVIQHLELLIIDEISMVRADLLDSLDMYLRGSRRSNAPFGGVQVLFIGDLYQLPPVVKQEENETFLREYRTPFFFSSHVFKEILQDLFQSLAYIELTTVYRQKDQDFIDLLDAVREQTLQNSHISALNQRFNPDWEKTSHSTILLTTTNKRADTINEMSLEALNTEAVTFEGTVAGDFPLYNLPTNQELILKVGARVMFVKNDPTKKWVNGTIGTVKEIHDQSIVVEVDTAGRLVEVEPVSWETYRTNVNETTGEFEKEVTGSFTQFPIKLAWAITIHKSQGQTFDKLILDLEKGAFTFGQTYVGLSRCTSLKGLTLARPITPKDIKTDTRIQQFFSWLRKNYGR